MMSGLSRKRQSAETKVTLTIKNYSLDSDNYNADISKALPLSRNKVVQRLDTSNIN